MINMMKDILQYVPYALFLAVVAAIIVGGAVYTLFHFRKTNRRYAKTPTGTDKK